MVGGGGFRGELALFYITTTSGKAIILSSGSSGFIPSDRSGKASKTGDREVDTTGWGRG